MDPLPPTPTGCSSRYEPDTPRSCDLKYLRAKRVAYYESIGIIKADAPRNGIQQVLAPSRDTKGSPSENESFGLTGPHTAPHYLSTGRKPRLQEMPQVAPREAEQCQDQRAWQQQPWRESHPPGLDLHPLADAFVPGTQKLRHVLNWAQKFLSHPPEEHGLKSPTASPGLPPSNPRPSSKALECKGNSHVRSSDSPALPSGEQPSTQTHSHSCSLRPPSYLSQMGLSAELSSSFQKEVFLDSPSCGRQKTTIRNEGEARAPGCPPDKLRQEDCAPEEYNTPLDRAGHSCIQSPNEDEMLPERQGAQPQLSLTSEGSHTFEEASQNAPSNSYSRTPLTHSLEEDGDEPGESQETPQRGGLSRKYRGFGGAALSPTGESMPVPKTMALSGVPSPGETLLEAEVMVATVGPPKHVTVEFEADTSTVEDPIQRLPVGQLIPPYDSSNQKGKESDNAGFTLWFPRADAKHKNKWKRAATESAGKALVQSVLRGGLNTSGMSSNKSSPTGITQRRFDPTYPESYVTPQTVGLSLRGSKGPSQDAVFHGHPGASAFYGPNEEARGTHSSTWSDQSPPARTGGGGSVQTPQAVTRQTVHEKKEKPLSLSHPISRDISKTGLKGSFPLPDVADSLSWSDGPPCKPEQEASVLETYFYYLHMLNKVRGLSPKDRSTSSPFQGPRLSESKSAVTPPVGKGRSNGARLDRESKECRDRCKGDAAVKGEGDTCSQGRACVEDAAPEETSLWRPQSNSGKLYSVTLKTTSRKTSCGGYQEMSTTECSSHKHGDVKLRPRSISRPSSSEAEERTSTGTYPTAYAAGAQKRGWYPPWLLLPEEVWTAVFSLLPRKELARVAQACHRFHQLASDESLWRQVQISDCCALEDDWLVALARRQPRSLTLRRCRHAGQAVTDRGLKRLFHHCAGVLQELNVTSCSGSGLMGDRVLLHAGALCSRLTAVDISWSGATDVGVMALIQGVSSLQGLSINGCQITDKAIKALVKKHGNSLYRVEVSGCLALTPRSIYSLALQCPHLQTLNIGSVPKVSEACLVRSLENLREVTALNVAGLKMVRDETIHFIVTRCPKLDSLVLSNCSQVTDVSLVEISTYLRTLRHLDVSGCPQVTNAGVRALARSCHRLKYLDLSSTGITERGPPIIYFLNVFHVVAVAGDMAYAFKGFILLHIPTALSTFGTPLGLSGVFSLANYCHISLECVKLSFCKNVTLDVVKKLCKNCRRLKILHLYGCTIPSALFKMKDTYKRVKVFHDVSTLTC